MTAAVRLRDDFDAATILGLAKGSRDPDQLRRLLSLAEIYDGGPLTDLEDVVKLIRFHEWQAFTAEDVSVFSANTVVAASTTVGGLFTSVTVIASAAVSSGVPPSVVSSTSTVTCCSW